MKKNIEMIITRVDKKNLIDEDIFLSGALATKYVNNRDFKIMD